jgi:hypothetical protein
MKPAPSDLLAQLDDITGLDYISWWPLAPGWWVLMALIVIAATAYYLRRRAYWRSWKGDAHRALDALEEQVPQGNAQQIAATLSALLRRIAMRCFSRAECAGLEGTEWLRWLTMKDPRRFDWTAHGMALVDAPYAPPGRDYPAQNLKLMIGAAKRWVR